MSCHLIFKLFDRSSYSSFVLGEETLQRFVNVGIYEEATFGISYNQIPCLKMLKTSVMGLG